MKKKNKILLIAANALCVLLIALCLVSIGGLDSLLQSQQAAELWAGDSDESFAQVSCFFPGPAPTYEETIYSFRNGLDQKLIDAGLEEPETGRLWTDAYSANGSVSITGDHGSAFAKAYGVGGNFFLFHPYELLDGSYIYENDLMNDRVVLSYELAWNLFGSADLEGMTVTINNVPCYVAGVVRCETDKFSSRVLPEEPVLFMSYSLFSSMFGVSGGEEGAPLGAGITCYEIAMADPITGYVKSAVTDSLASEECDVVENSSRFSFSRTLSMFTHFGDRSIDTKSVAYPYWENAARVCEVYIARDYVFILLLALFPLATVVWLIARLIKFLLPKFRRVKASAADAWDDRYYTADKLEKRRKAKKGAHLKKKKQRSDEEQ